MEMMKDLFIKVYSPQAAKDQNTNPNATGKEKTCMFNPNCKVDGCPFKIGEPVTQFVDRLINGSPPVKTKTTAPSNEIVDDADLFIVSVRQPDPCTINEPVYRNRCTQYLESDVPVECLPPPKPTKVNTKSKSKKKTMKKKK